MKNRSPIKGLLVYSYYASGPVVGANFLVCLIVAISFLFAGVNWGFQILVFMAGINLPMSAMIGMASKEGKWERYQLTMPIKRGQLIAMQYLTMLIVTALAVVLLATFVGASSILHDDMFYGSLIDTFLGTAHTFSLPLLMAGLVFPLASSKIGKDRETMVMLVCMTAAMAIHVAVPMIGYRIGLSVDIIPTAFLAITAAYFIVSYFISKSLYNKLDF